MNDWVLTIILGLVEGLTEFLPVSSTAHLILVGDALGFSGDAAHSFEIFIQAGAILAVVYLYSERFLGLLRFDSKTTSGLQGIRGLTTLAVVCIPAGVLGLLFSKAIKAHLYAPIPIAIALIVGAIVMFIFERREWKPSVTSIEGITLRQAFAIGCIQCVALWPGVSRSAATILGGMGMGLSRTVAAEFSFFAAVPLLSAAAAHELIKVLPTLSWQETGLFGLGFLISFFSAIFAIRGLLAVLNRWGMVPFAWYRIGLGILVLALMAF